ncbi:MAG: cytochrome bc complex cytochrome b subunit [Deltaproteobacteria bacterium]|nr:MAG: cytochrome bc complex cytochrome b subunit [Deltaproteobacteria bacterium]
MASKFLDWLDDRAGYRRILRWIGDEPVLGGDSWAYVFGSALLIVFFVQAATGVVLATYYSASTAHAWGSVYYVQEKVTLGWLVRGLHHWGASAMVVLLGLHLLQVFIWGAYKKPRELNWMTGALLLVVTLAFSLTGYLLPWDQKGYWATSVVTSIVGTIPGIGEWLKRVLQGGNGMGTLTLTRFYAFHVFFLPAALTFLTAFHVYLFRRHGITPRWGRSREELEATTVPFWPRQVFRDLAFGLLVVLVVLGLTIWAHGAPLEAPADPASDYVARPEWYFLFLFSALKYFEGPWQVVGTFVLPVVALTLLLALPFLDRGSDRSPRARWRQMVGAGCIVTVVLVLTALPIWHDAHDPAYQAQARRAADEARRAKALAAKGIPVRPMTDLWLQDPVEHGRRLFRAHCSNCHTVDGEGGREGPDLGGYLSRDWLLAFLRNPADPQFYGHTKFAEEGMEPVDLPEPKLLALVDYLMALADTPAKQLEQHPGRAVYTEAECDDCHGIPGETEPLLVRLDGYGGEAWLRRVLLEPSAEDVYGEYSEMPRFDTLSEQEIRALVAFLRAQRREPFRRHREGAPASEKGAER